MASDQTGHSDTLMTTTATTSTGDITHINQVHDNLYVTFHDGLFDLICTSDVNIAEEKSRLFKETLTTQVTTLEASAAKRIRVLSTSELPPEVRGCIAHDPIRPGARKLHDDATDAFDDKDLEIKCGNDFDQRDDDDDDDEEENYTRGRGRLASLLSVQGYGLDVTDLQQNKRPPNNNNKTRQMQQRRLKRKQPESEAKGEDSAWLKVLNDSAAIRVEFKEEFDPKFFPRSYQVTEIYLPRTIYEKHSLRYKAKKRIRPDRDTLSGLIVTLRKDPPPWAFV